MANRIYTAATKAINFVTPRTKLGKVSTAAISALSFAYAVLLLSFSELSWLAPLAFGGGSAGVLYRGFKIDQSPPTKVSSLTLKRLKKIAPKKGLDIISDYLIIPASKTGVHGTIVLNGKLLGGGAQGEVYLAVDVRSGERVALKVFDTADRASSINAEYAALNTLNHQSIVKAQGGGTRKVEDKDLSYIAMEYVPLPTLDTLLTSGHKFTTAQLIDIGIAVADALAYAHGQGIAHRDIKPSQIFVNIDRKGKVVSVKVADFGLARQVLDQTQFIQGDASGTPKYMPAYVLEYAVRGQDPATALQFLSRADGYSLLATLYTLATNLPAVKVEFNQYANDYLAYRQAKSGGDTAAATDMEAKYALATDDPNLSPELAQILVKGLSIDPDKGYQVALEIKHALETVKSDLEADARVIALVRGPKPDIDPDQTRVATPRPRIIKVNLVDQDPSYPDSQEVHLLLKGRIDDDAVKKVRLTKTFTAGGSAITEHPAGLTQEKDMLFFYATASLFDQPGDLLIELLDKEGKVIATHANKIEGKPVEPPPSKLCLALDTNDEAEVAEIVARLEGMDTELWEMIDAQPDDHFDAFNAAAAKFPTLAARLQILAATVYEEAK